MNITILGLPLIARDFSVTLREVSWVVIAFSLTVTALLLPMGRLSDLIGRKKTLLSGIILFIIGSMICYFAGSFSMLILGRVVMGLGASLGQGVGTAIVVSVFPQKERGKAIGSHTTAVAIGAAGCSNGDCGGMGSDCFSTFFLREDRNHDRCSNPLSQRSPKSHHHTSQNQHGETTSKITDHRTDDKKDDS